jgi:hypothetical protein
MDAMTRQERIARDLAALCREVAAEPRLLPDFIAILDLVQVEPAGRNPHIKTGKIINAA